MKLDAAITRIQQSFQRMNEVYQRPVFDEVAIVGLVGPEPELYHYQGPRRDEFLRSFADDSVSLRRELTDDQREKGGEFSFTREGEGSGIDAYICLGSGIYLFCNNTEKSMEAVTADPLWLTAQSEFLNTTQYFAVDPLVVRDEG